MKIFIYALEMTVGGVEKALLGQLTQYPSESCDVTLLLREKRGDYLAFLPKHVKVVEHEEWKRVCNLVRNPVHISALNAMKSGRFLQALRLLLIFIQTKVRRSYQPLHNYVQTLPSDYPGEYDLAIDYAGPTAFTANFVAKKVKAKEKWTWVHFDVDRFPVDRKVVENVYSAFHKINVVSAEGKRHFDLQFPMFAQRTSIVYNIIDRESIESLANVIPNPYQDIKAKIIICTVGRISSEKGQLTAIHALKELVDGGADVHWCFVGTGTDVKRCKEEVMKLGLESRVTFAGLQTNPYPWMKHCDIYVQPSAHEGFCITLAEAKIFNLPIVSTSFTGAFEQLQDYLPLHAVVEYNAREIAGGVKGLLKCLSPIS